ncbi:MAG: carboxypeptidase regulatory-like domain-containing protein, partial [Bradyrhizobiaceae bacterium]|nr:carboxypeptidase regulatory-like domain-containing protein [Bradyrhizobiaceae bacterium]
MNSRHFAAMLALGIAVAASSGASRAEGVAALTGAVTSAEEGAMAGVTVTATPVGPKSTISVTVTTDDHGRYSFAAGRLAPGTYALAIRAVGYDLDGKVTATVAASAPAVANLRLKTTSNLPSQLTSAEWLASWPGTD